MVAPKVLKIYKPVKDRVSTVEVMDNERLIEEDPRKKGKVLTMTWVVIMILVIVLMIICLFCSVMFLRQVIIWLNKQAVEKDDPLLKELDAKKFQQNDNSIIFWNFQSGYQTVKTLARGEPVCYVFQIDNSSYNVFVHGKDKKPTRTNVFKVNSDATGVDEELIPTMGVHAYEACKEERVMWLAPYPMNYHHNGPSNTSPSEIDDGSNTSHRRLKRNIRSCRTSCCYRVCCCDVHHFIWEVAEEFNCNHICSKCSKSYHPVIQRIC